MRQKTVERITPNKLWNRNCVRDSKKTLFYITCARMRVRFDVWNERNITKKARDISLILILLLFKNIVTSSRCSDETFSDRYNTNAVTETLKIMNAPHPYASSQTYIKAKRPKTFERTSEQNETTKWKDAVDKRTSVRSMETSVGLRIVYLARLWWQKRSRRQNPTRGKIKIQMPN